MQHQQLLDLAHSWKLQKPSSDQQQLINQLYDHQNNQIKKRRSKRASVCRETWISLCIKEDCQTHPQPELKTNQQQSKVFPTKFFKAPLPVCWFVLSCQLLATIDWPACFYKILRQSQTAIFTRITTPMLHAKVDISDNTFKSAPSANLFINSFKTN